MPLPTPGPVKLTPEEAAQEKEKRVKNLRKKIKQLDEIKTKKAAGQTLEPEQIKKLETEASLLAELRELA
jgi:translation initiation factor 2A